MISYEKEVDTDKLNNYWKIVAIINNMFRPKKTLKKTRISLYNKLPLSALLHGSENCTIQARDTRRITAAEMNYMRKKAGICGQIILLATDFFFQILAHPVFKM